MAHRHGGWCGWWACVHTLALRASPPPPPPPCYPTSLRELAHASRHSLTQPPTIAAPQEDAHAAVLDLPEGGPRSALFAVLDGHGGAEVARFVAAPVVSEGSSGGLYGLYAGGQQRGAGQVGGWVQSGGCMVSMAHRTAVL